MKNILDEKRMVIFNVDLMQGGIILIRWVMSLVEVMIELQDLHNLQDF